MPGPICNPSKAAIRAALFPEETKYYFFVTDNTGKYYYSNSYSQHLKNCATAEKVNNKLKNVNFRTLSILQYHACAHQKKGRDFEVSVFFYQQFGITECETVCKK